MDTHVPKKQGHFIISLDFELFWGMIDKETIATYGEHVAGERTAVPRMLEHFSQYGIHATWATVGMLMAEHKKELYEYIPPPHLRPTYPDARMSSYYYLENETIGEDETEDIYHYGHTLVEKILNTPHQEISNHTFSHFYCIDVLNDDGSSFEADIDAFNAISRKYDVHAQSIVFPRNQASERVLATCINKGLIAYRGNESHVLYTPRKDSEQSYLIRGFRLLDHYINLSGYHTYPLPQYISGTLVNLPSSRFLRPWNSLLRHLEWLKVRRITKAMTYAAQRGEVFHLWWHPHNFGVNQDQNFECLSKILKHYTMLKEKYGMQSVTMTELAEKIVHRDVPKSVS